MKVLDVELECGTFPLETPHTVPTTFAWHCDIKLGGKEYGGYGHNALQAFCMAVASHEIDLAIARGEIRIK